MYVVNAKQNDITFTLGCTESKVHASAWVKEMRRLGLDCWLEWINPLGDVPARNWEDKLVQVCERLTNGSFITTKTRQELATQIQDVIDEINEAFEELKYDDPDDR